MFNDFATPPAPLSVENVENVEMDQFDHVFLNGKAAGQLLCPRARDQPSHMSIESGIESGIESAPNVICQP